MSESINRRVQKIIDGLEEDYYLKNFIIDLIKLEIKNSNDNWKYSNEYERKINSYIRKHGDKIQ